MTIKMKMTANELQNAHRAAKSKVELHFTAKEKPETPDFVEDAIETLDNDMKDEVRAEVEPFKAEFNAAINGIYLDDLSGGDSEAGEIIPAADLLQKVIPLALTDFSSTAYRKNPDGTFSRDKAAFKRLEQLERKIFAANGHKIGIDNPDWYAANFDDDNAPRI